MKIGITCYPTYGGSGAVATELGIALADRGHEVHFITYRQPFRLPSFLPRIFFHEVDVGRYPLFEFPPYDLALAVRMHEVVRTHGLELLHCHYAIPHATSAWIAREMLRETKRRRSPDHDAARDRHHDRRAGSVVLSRSRSSRSRSRIGSRRCRNICADETLPRVRLRRPASSRSFTTSSIPTSTIAAKYPSILKDQVGRSKPILMHVSNFRAVKRVRDVVRVFAEVNRELPCVLVMIGDGPDRPAAEEEARMLGVEQSVSFLGKLDQIAPLLAAADLFLLPSQTESFGLSALEALASGVPVIGTNTGGLPEVIRDGETGILCAVGDVAGMAAAALEILRDPRRWKQMSDLASSRRARAILARRHRQQDTNHSINDHSPSSKS